MNIIVLENEPSSQRGGQELSLLSVCQGLAARGHQVTLLYRIEGNLLANYQAFCQRVIPINSYRLNFDRSSLFSFFNDILKVPLGKDSLVYGNQYQDSFFGAAFSYLRRIPFVCHLRLPPPPRFIRQWTFGMKSARRLIAVSQHTKTEWISQGFDPARIDVVWNSIDVEKFCPDDDSQLVRSQLHLAADNPLISYVGRIDQCKGIETLLEAFATVHTQFPNTHLAIVGKPLSSRTSYLNELKALTEKLAIAPYTHFLGHFDQPQQIYQASTVTVLPSIWTEPFGRSLIESMSCGVPAIGSRIGGIPEVLSGEFTDALFTPKDASALALVLNRWLDWRSHDPSLGDRCRQHIIKHFSLGKMLNGIEKNFQSALE